MTESLTGARCGRQVARRRGLRPDLLCGNPAKVLRDGKPLCGRCVIILDRREAKAQAEADRLSSEMEEADMAQQCVTCCHNEASHSSGECFMCGCLRFVKSA